jgi:pyoverdine/dityrosine biosynthesis protein Dit1
MNAEVAHRLIDDICNLMMFADTEGRHRENLHMAIKQCEAMGGVHIREVREMAQAGLPVVATYSAIQRITTYDGLKKIENREMSYPDLLCIIGIIAQDLMVRSRTNQYKNITKELC